MALVIIRSRRINELIENHLSFDRHAEAEGPALALAAAGRDGAAAAHDGRRRRALPHDTGGEDDASLGVCDLDPLGVGLVERLHRDQPHLPLLPSQRDHQLLALQVLHLQTNKRAMALETRELS